jgi:hypothetical protein
MPEDEITALYANCPVADAEVSDEEVSTIAGITQRTAKDGSRYATIGLPLVETNGLSFKFQHGNALVVVSNDIELYKIHKANPLAVGTVMEFNFEGPETFRKLDTAGKFLVANNNQESPYRGTISKANNTCFEEILVAKQIAQMERKIAVMEIADEEGISVRKVRQVLNANLATNIADKLKAKLAK